MRNYPSEILNHIDSESSAGPAQWVGQAVAASFIAVLGDTSAGGTLKIQGSNDIPVGAQAQFVPTNFADIPSATSTIAAGVGPAIVLQTMNFQYIRAVFTHTTGGTTTIRVLMSALGV